MVGTAGAGPGGAVDAVGGSAAQGGRGSGVRLGSDHIMDTDSQNFNERGD
jgi:hypothetical protein